MGLLHMHPLAIVLQEELVASWSILERNAVDGARTIDGHACRHMLPHSLLLP